MNILEVPARVRKARRLRQIAGTFIKYKLISAKERLLDVTPGALLARARGRERAIHDERTGATRIREIIQELGTTYIKFGQWLSVRPDFVPPDVIHELEKLQDRLPPISFATVTRVVERELGRPLRQVFAEFDRYPVSTASIAQVHRAVLVTGEEVAVKVQRPGLKQLISDDLLVIRSLTDWAIKHYPYLAFHRPDDLIASFRVTLMEELEFTTEARNQERIAENFKGNRWLRIPKVYWSHTTDRLLVMEFLPGFKLTTPELFAEWGLDRKLLARRLSRCMYRQIFEHGFFHADPHPGNILFMKDNQVGLVDFGIVARHSDDLRSRFLDWFYAVVYRDLDLFEETFLAVGRPAAPIDRVQFRNDCLDYIDELHFQRSGRLSFVRVLGITNRILYRHKISAPPTFLFFFKAISTMEGVARGLDPDFDWREHWGPKLRRMMEARSSPAELFNRYRQAARRYDRAFVDFPDDFRAIVKRIKDGRIEGELSIPELRGYVTELRIALNKVAVAIVVAATILGLFVVGRGRGLGFLPWLAVNLVGLWWIVALLLLVAFYFRRR
jgi:ubiquinone biosynthesis protein